MSQQSFIHLRPTTIHELAHKPPLSNYIKTLFNKIKQDPLYTNRNKRRSLKLDFINRFYQYVNIPAAQRYIPSRITDTYLTNLFTRYYDEFMTQYDNRLVEQIQTNTMSDGTLNNFVKRLRKTDNTNEFVNRLFTKHDYTTNEYEFINRFNSLLNKNERLALKKMLYKDHHYPILIQDETTQQDIIKSLSPAERQKISDYMITKDINRSKLFRLDNYTLGQISKELLDAIETHILSGMPDWTDYFKPKSFGEYTTRELIDKINNNDINNIEYEDVSLIGNISSDTRTFNVRIPVSINNQLLSQDELDEYINDAFADHYDINKDHVSNVKIHKVIANANTNNDCLRQAILKAYGYDIGETNDIQVAINKLSTTDISFRFIDAYTGADIIRRAKRDNWQYISNINDVLIYNNHAETLPHNIYNKRIDNEKHVDDIDETEIANTEHIIRDVAENVYKECIYSYDYYDTNTSSWTKVINDRYIHKDNDVNLINELLAYLSITNIANNEFYPVNYRYMYDRTIHKYSSTDIMYKMYIDEEHDYRLVSFDVKACYLESFKHIITWGKYPTWYNIAIKYKLFTNHDISNPTNPSVSKNIEPNDLIWCYSEKYCMGGFLTYELYNSLNTHVKESLIIKYVYKFKQYIDNDNKDLLDSAYKECFTDKRYYTKLFGAMISKNKTKITAWDDVDKHYYQTELPSIRNYQFKPNTSYFHVYILIHKFYNMLSDAYDIEQLFDIELIGCHVDKLVYLVDETKQIDTTRMTTRFIYHFNPSENITTLDYMSDSFKHKNNKVIYKYGIAGSGKTYSVLHDKHLKRDKNIVVVQNGQLLKLWDVFADTYIDKYLLKNWDVRCHANNVIIDEAFLLDNNTIDNIVNICGVNNLNLYIIGDPFQFIFSDDVKLIGYNYDPSKYSKQNYRNTFDYDDILNMIALNKSFRVISNGVEQICEIIQWMQNEGYLNITLIDDIYDLSILDTKPYYRLTKDIDAKIVERYKGDRYRCETTLDNIFIVGDIYTYDDIIGYLQTKYTKYESVFKKHFIHSPVYKFYATQGKTLDSINIILNRDSDISNQCIDNPRFLYVLISRFTYKNKQ